MSKYDPLQRFLKNAKPGTQELTLTFAQIESILGSTLPASAYRYRQWWANPSQADQHPHAQAWLAVGWEVDTVDLGRQWARFRRVD